MRWILLFSDIHSGHRLGLLNPETTLEEQDAEGRIVTYHPQLSAYQQHLWGLFTQNLEQVRGIVGEDEIVAISNGDITQGVRYPDLWVSTRMSDQVDIALWTMRALLKLAQIKVLRLCVGTASHEFGEGSAPRLVINALKPEFPSVDIKVVQHGLLWVDGVSIDYAHHGPGASQRHWLQGNTARFYLRDLMQREIKAGRPVPRIVVRSHVHTHVRETLRDEDRGELVISDLFITPSWCGMGDYAVQVTRSNYLVTHGMVLLGVEEGELRVEHSLVATTDVRTEEVV